MLNSGKPKVARDCHRFRRSLRQHHPLMLVCHLKVSSLPELICVWQMKGKYTFNHAGIWRLLTAKAKDPKGRLDGSQTTFKTPLQRGKLSWLLSKEEVKYLQSDLYGDFKPLFSLIGFRNQSYLNWSGLYCKNLGTITTNTCSLLWLYCINPQIDRFLVPNLQSNSIKENLNRLTIEMRSYKQIRSQ